MVCFAQIALHIRNIRIGIQLIVKRAVHILHAVISYPVNLCLIIVVCGVKGNPFTGSTVVNLRIKIPVLIIATVSPVTARHHISCLKDIIIPALLPFPEVNPGNRVRKCHLFHRIKYFRFVRLPILSGCMSCVFRTFRFCRLSLRCSHGLFRHSVICTFQSGTSAEEQRSKYQGCDNLSKLHVCRSPY